MHRRAFNFKFSTGRNVTFVSLVILHFLDGSYDFRAGCRPHYALQVLRVQIVSKKVNRVLGGLWREVGFAVMRELTQKRGRVNFPINRSDNIFGAAFRKSFIAGNCASGVTRQNSSRIV
jgi:hypothetical protein